jgi:hypothetical protein
MIRSDMIKREEQQFDEFANNLALKSQFYFCEWLKCVSAIEFKNKQEQALWP